MVKENDFDGIAWCYDFMAKLIFGERLYQASIQWLETLNKLDTVVVLGGGSGKILKQLTQGPIHKPLIRRLYKNQEGRRVVVISGVSW